MRLKDLSDRAQFLLRIAYDGSYFHGVQEQPGFKTVLGTLRNRLEQAAGQRAKKLFIAARTDSGVHALLNYVTFYVQEPIDIINFCRQIAELRHDGLWLIDSKHVSPHVHARGNSRGKTYRYTILDNSHGDLFREPMAWQIVPKLTIKAMQEAASFLIGEQDFSSLRGGGCRAANTTKIISSIKIHRTSSCAVIIDISGNAFLRKMVRNMVGLLSEVGVGLRQAADIPAILEAKSRRAAGITAPARGLCLIKLGFDDSH